MNLLTVILTDNQSSCKTSKKYKASMDTSTGTYSYEATGTIDEKAKTVKFDEGS